MQKLRDHIKRTPLLWLACLLPALLFMLSMQLHIHVHATHHHDSKVQSHHHHNELHQAHLGNTHDAKHSSDQHHSGIGTYIIDISPDGLNKSFTIQSFAWALISFVILFLSPQTQRLILKRHNEESPYIRWRAELPPQLRAPPH